MTSGSASRRWAVMNELSGWSNFIIYLCSSLCSRDKGFLIRRLGVIRCWGVSPSFPLRIPGTNGGQGGTDRMVLLRWWIIAKDLRRLSLSILSRLSDTLLRTCTPVIQSASIRARLARSHAILVRTVGSRGKIIEFRKWVRADGLAPLLPVRRAHFTVLVLPSTTSALIHQTKKKKYLR
jgi:hypothetical protein